MESQRRLSGLSTRLLTQSPSTGSTGSIGSMEVAAVNASPPSIHQSSRNGNEIDDDKVNVELNVELVKKVVVKVLRYTSANADLLTEDENRRLFCLLRHVGCVHSYEE